MFKILSNELKSNEIWLEGQELEIRKYRKLYQVYGNTYGEASDADHFVVPNFVGRSIWGISSTSQFGYIEAGLPSITHNHSATSTTTSSSASAGAHTHSTNSTGAHTHTRGTMNITGTFLGCEWNEGNIKVSGAFTSSANNMIKAASGQDPRRVVTFNASRAWTGDTSENGNHTHTANSSGAHTHTITSSTSTTIANNSSVNSIYGKASTVRPPSIGIRVKTRAK